MAQLTGNVQNQLGIDEHDPKVLAKKVVLWGYNPDTDEAYRLGPNDPLITGSATYATKITESGTTTYIAKAPPGSAESSAVWQAQKIDESSGTRITWADGNANFDNVATDLTVLAYS